MTQPDELDLEHCQNPHPQRGATYTGLVSGIARAHEPRRKDGVERLSRSLAAYPSCSSSVLALVQRRACGLKIGIHALLAAAPSVPRRPKLVLGHP